MTPIQRRECEHIFADEGLGVDEDGDDEGWDDSVADGCIRDITITGEVSNVLIQTVFRPIIGMDGLGICDFRKVFYDDESFDFRGVSGWIHEHRCSLMLGRDE